MRAVAAFGLYVGYCRRKVDGIARWHTNGTSQPYGVSSICWHNLCLDPRGDRSMLFASIRRGTRGLMCGSVFLLGLSNAVANEEKPVTLPTVTAIAEADFAKHSPLGAPSISPNGQFIAVSVHSDDGGESKYQLAVLHLPDLKFVSRLDMTEHHLPIDITWVDNKRLVMESVERLPFPILFTHGCIIAVDIDGKNKRVLYSDRARGSLAALQNILDSDWIRINQRHSGQGEWPLLSDSESGTRGRRNRCAGKQDFAFRRRC